MVSSDFHYLTSKYSNLQTLNLTMNKIMKLEMVECPCLTELVLADNHLQDLHPNTFAKLRNLRKLDLSINKLTQIPNLGNLVNLEELMLRQNNISVIENLS